MPQATLKEIIGADKEAQYFAALDTMAENAFDDQCTGANPRYPLISDLKRILSDAWSAPILPLKNLDAEWGPAPIVPVPPPGPLALAPVPEAKGKKPVAV